MFTPPPPAPPPPMLKAGIRQCRAPQPNDFFTYHPTLASWNVQYRHTAGNSSHSAENMTHSTENTIQFSWKFASFCWEAVDGASEWTIWRVFGPFDFEKRSVGAQICSGNFIKTLRHWSSSPSKLFVSSNSFSENETSTITRESDRIWLCSLMVENKEFNTLH